MMALESQNSDMQSINEDINGGSLDKKSKKLTLGLDLQSNVSITPIMVENQDMVFFDTGNQSSHGKGQSNYQQFCKTDNSPIDTQGFDVN